MKEIKDKVSQEWEVYVPADVKVIEIAAQGIICTSGGTYNDPFGTPDPI